MTIYLDNLAATPTDPRVAQHLAATSLALVGNPNSLEHAAGRAAHSSIALACDVVGGFIDRPGEEIHFTPSASSALWLAVQDTIARAGPKRSRVLASAVEHPALLRHLRDGERDGRVELTLFPVDGRGQPDLEALRRLSRDGVDLVCMMAANNETGTIAPVEEVMGIARERGARTLVDASQAAGRMPLAATLANADHVVISGAKMYGPRTGVLCGALTRRASDHAHAVFGTPNAPGATAMALACELRRDEMGQDEARLATLRDRLQAILTDLVPGLVVNGDPNSRLAGALHVSCPNLPGEAVVARLDGRVDLSTGAACQSGAPGPSHVLTSMKVPDWVAEGAVRLCVGRFNTTEQIEAAGSMVAEAMLGGQAAARRRA